MKEDARLIHALAEGRLISLTDKESQTTHTLTEEWDLIQDVGRVEKAVRRVVNLPLDSELFKPIDQPNGRRLWEPQSDVAELAKCYAIDVEKIKQTFPMHKFNPYFELFCSNSKVPDTLQFGGRLLSEAAYQVMRDRVISIQQGAREKMFMCKIENHERSMRKNYQSLAKYVDALHDRYSKLLVIRIDLGYARGSNPEYQQVWSDRKRFLRDLRSLIPKAALLGYVWKLEFGLSKSYHYHAIIIADGQKVREDITIARMLGEHWSKNVTNGEGVYYNCNAEKGNYRNLGIGLVRHNDQRMREALLMAAAYLTKPDYYVRVAAPELGRVFGKACMPRQPPRRSGRPRRHFQPK